MGEDPDLRNRVVVLTVRPGKGLEFDSVLVADPGRIIAESPRGAQRPLRRDDPRHPALCVLHHGDVPELTSATTSPKLRPCGRA